MQTRIGLIASRMIKAPINGFLTDQLKAIPPGIRRSASLNRIFYIQNLLKENYPPIYPPPNPLLSPPECTKMSATTVFSVIRVQYYKNQYKRYIGVSARYT